MRSRRSCGAIALRALSQQAGVRVVVLTRSFEMEAVAGRPSWRVAAALELHAVDACHRGDYLTRVQLDPPPHGWSDLTGGCAANRAAPSAKALSNPLTLTLVRDTYRSGDDIRELLDFCDAVGDVSGEGHPGPSARSGAARRLRARAGSSTAPVWLVRSPARRLGCIAASMSRDGTRDLTWWRISAWCQRPPGSSATVLMFGLVLGLGGPILGLVAAPVFGLGYMLGRVAAQIPQAHCTSAVARRMLNRLSLMTGLGYAVAGAGSLAGSCSDLCTGPLVALDGARGGGCGWAGGHRRRLVYPARRQTRRVP
jgi:hypothetical protein